MVVKPKQSADQGEVHKPSTLPKSLGRLVLVTGDKGGTGKSVVARILLDIYRHRNINCIAYECDQSNPQLYRHYNKVAPGVQTLKLNQRGGADALQDDLKRLSPKVSLVDLPAGAAEYFESVAKDIFLFQNAHELNQWSQLTAEQLKVQADHTENIKNLATSCNQLGTALSALNLTSQQQLKQLTSLTKLSENLSNISPRQPETLSQPLQEQLNEIQEKISLLNQKEVDSAVKGWGRAIMIWLFSPISFFILFWFYSHLTPIPTPIETTESLQKILQNTDWSNAKLQRVEKRLGTDPNSRRRR